MNAEETQETENPIEAAAQSFAAEQQEEPQPAQEPEPLMVNIPFARLIELLAAEKTLYMMAIMQNQQTDDAEADELSKIKCKLEISDIIRATKSSREDYYNEKRFKSKVRKIHTRLLQPDSTRHIG